MKYSSKFTSTFALVLLSALVCNLVLAGCSGTSIGSSTESSTGTKPVESTPTKPAAYQQFTLQVPTSYRVEQSHDSSDAVDGIVMKPPVDVPGLYLTVIPAERFGSTQRVAEEYSLFDSALPGSVHFQSAAATQLAQISFERMNFTTGSGNGFVLVGANGSNKVVLACGPSTQADISDYEKIILTLKRQ